MCTTGGLPKIQLGSEPSSTSKVRPQIPPPKKKKKKRTMLFTAQELHRATKCWQLDVEEMFLFNAQDEGAGSSVEPDDSNSFSAAIA